ncbi:MAG: sigma 54-interacting transcriptional regulator [Clostridia bacterium]|nr:sigma 54-interacting transcriptional regulator [Clostridia bacterium]
MAYKIGIIASDIEMKKKLEELYPEETASGQYMIKLLDNRVISAQGQELVAAGAQLIIGRSGSYVNTVGNVSVPVLRLKVSTGDIVNALVKAAQYHKRIDLFLWDQIAFDEGIFDLMASKVTVHRFSDGPEIEGLFYGVIDEQFDGVIVGGGIVCSLARQLNVPSVFVSPSNESIDELLGYAKQVLDSVHEVRYKNELLTTVVQGSHDAVLAIDEHHEVILFNERARDILKISPKYVIGKKLMEVLPELAFIVKHLEDKIEQQDELIHYKDMALAYNTSLIRVDDYIKGMFFSFQNVTKLQRLEQKIRYELNEKGLVAKYEFSDIIYEDAIMSEIIEQAKKVGKSHSTAIIYGESGTGKEIMASSLHNVSDRKSAPFVAINCAALTESLLESELFGYEEGAFTGSRKGGKPGLFELAHGGTIFLDEINSISPTIQTKLLRVVEEKEVMRIGSDYVIPLDVRIICAANENLTDMVEVGRFRKDLFYRLSRLEIHLPPLRERKGDIYPLFQYFLKGSMPDEEIVWPSEEGVWKLTQYDWPGNIRELKNVCERYVLFGEIMLPDVEGVMEGELPESLSHYHIDLKEIHHLVEVKLIDQLLAGGLNKTQVAELLGISRTALWKKTQK